MGGSIPLHLLSEIYQKNFSIFFTQLFRSFMGTSLEPLVDNNGKLILSIGDIKKRYGIKKDSHINFAFHYLNDPKRNGSKAYATVYNNGVLKRGHAVGASTLLHIDSPVGQLVNDLDTQNAQVMQQKNIITKEQVLKELIKTGFSDIRDLYDENDDLIKISNLNLDTTPAIRKIKEKIIRRSVDDTTGEVTTVLQREVEMHDKKGALQLIGQHLNMFVQKGEIEVRTTVKDLVRDITANNANKRNGLLPKDNCIMPELDDEKTITNVPETPTNETE